MTVGEAVNAYRTLRDLDPSSLGEPLTNEVMDALSDLEPAVQRFQRKAEAHQERLTEGEDTDEEALEDALGGLMEEEADVEASIDVSTAPSMGVRYDLENAPVLDPLT